MANSTISALTSATTPLAGTETLPIVQSGATVKATVANITGAGAYAGSFTSLAYTTTLTGGTGIVNLGSNQFYKDAAGNIGIGAVGYTSAWNKLSVFGANSATTFSSQLPAIFTLKNTDTTAGNFTLIGIADPLANTNTVAFGGVNITTTGSSIAAVGAFIVATKASGASLVTERMRISAAGDVTISTGNVVQGTAAKGFDFSANTPLAGKTSTILNWYEEGTWTPNQGAGLTLVGAFSSTGRYTRIGRQVSISGTVTGATSVALAAAGVITSNLPFTVVTAGHGDATNVAITASAAVICTGTSVTSAGAIAATATITFSATYFV